MYFCGGNYTFYNEIFVTFDVSYLVGSPREFINGKAVRLPKFYADGMVFQSQPASPIFFGFADQTNLQITLIQRCDGKEYHIRTVFNKDMSSNGMFLWSGNLHSLANGMQCIIEVPGAGLMTFHNESCVFFLGSMIYFSSGSINIVFGDVWLCFGQSNMEKKMSPMVITELELKAIGEEYPNLREGKHPNTPH